MQFPWKSVEKYFSSSFFSFFHPLLRTFYIVNSSRDITFLRLEAWRDSGSLSSSGSKVKRNNVSVTERSDAHVRRNARLEAGGFIYVSLEAHNRWIICCNLSWFTGVWCVHLVLAARERPFLRNRRVPPLQVHAEIPGVPLDRRQSLLHQG